MYICVIFTVEIVKTEINFMKKLICGIFALALVVSCNENEEKVGDYKINGTIEGLSVGETVYVNKVTDSNRIVVIDSTTVKEGGTFMLDLPEVTQKDFNYVNFKKAKGSILIIAENAPITVQGKSSAIKDVVVTGSRETTLFKNYLKENKEFANQEADLSRKNQVAIKDADYNKQKSLNRSMDSLVDFRVSSCKDLIKNNPNSLVSIIALSDLLNSKKVEAKEVTQYFEGLTPEIKDSRVGNAMKKVLQKLKSMNADIGQKVADFTAPSPAGNAINLMSSLGKKVTIIDFWASWCRPCRAENPNVVKVYEKYKDQGLEIIGVSLDKDKERWLEAIKQDKLTWPQVSHLKSWQDPIAQQYKVRSIPSTFIVDSKGIVVAKNLRGAALERKIQEMIKE